MYTQYTRGIATTRQRSLAERGGRKAFVRDEGLAFTQKKGEKNKKCQETPVFTSLKKRIRAHRASSKATGLFLTK